MVTRCLHCSTVVRTHVQLYAGQALGHGMRNMVLPRPSRPLARPWRVLLACFAPAPNWNPDDEVQ
eukprot:2162009-Alexandrium_andersonii.AAC.1